MVSRMPKPAPHIVTGATAPVGAPLSPPPASAESGADEITDSRLAVAGRASRGEAVASMLTPPPGQRSASPLTRSPGYYPPDDPESLSVQTGRREAPLVDLE